MAVLTFTCDECGYETVKSSLLWWGSVEWRYCPRCFVKIDADVAARMAEAQLEDMRRTEER